MVTTSPLFMSLIASRNACGSNATSSAGNVRIVRSMSLYAAPILRAMVSRAARTRAPETSQSTMPSITPRRRRSAKVMATTPAGLSGAAPASVKTHLVTHVPTGIDVSQYAGKGRRTAGRSAGANDPLFPASRREETCVGAGAEASRETAGRAPRGVLGSSTR